MTPDEILAFKIGESTVGENLRRAVEAGAVRQHDDGSFEIVGRGLDLFCIFARYRD